MTRGARTTRAASAAGQAPGCRAPAPRSPGWVRADLPTPVRSPRGKREAHPAPLPSPRSRFSGRVPSLRPRTLALKSGGEQTSNGESKELGLDSVSFYLSSLKLNWARR